eukprot:10175-Chlamydomonas_euryale.AAC.6
MQHHCIVTMSMHCDDAIDAAWSIDRNASLGQLRQHGRLLVPIQQQRTARVATLLKTCRTMEPALKPS